LILVTGATGLVGSQICRELKQKGLPYRALRRKSSQIPNDLLEVDWVEGDILDFESILDALKDISTVIHAAAVISFYKGDYELMETTNVHGTRNIVDASLTASVKKIIHISSVAALGRPIGINHIDENTQWMESSLNSYYGETKYLAELEVWRAMEEGLQTVIVNPSVILGTGDWTKGSTRLFKYAWDEHRYFPGGAFNYVDNRDISNVVCQLAQSNHNGERFILNAGSTTYESFFKLVGERFGKKAPTRKVSESLYFLAILMESVKSFFTRTKPIITRESLISTKKDYHFDASKIKKLLNFAFKDLEDTVEWVIAGLQKE